MPTWWNYDKLLPVLHPDEFVNKAGVQQASLYIFHVQRDPAGCSAESLDIDASGFLNC